MRVDVKQAGVGGATSLKESTIEGRRVRSTRTLAAILLETARGVDRSLRRAVALYGRVIREGA